MAVEPCMLGSAKDTVNFCLSLACSKADNFLHTRASSTG